VALRSVRAFLSKVYQIPYFIGLLASIVGLSAGRKRGILGSQSSRTWRSLGIGAWVTVGVLVLQISLLEASSGLYMSVGGGWYLLPAAPFVLLSIVAGTERLLLSRQIEQSRI
jgi:hypothetical protein